MELALGCVLTLSACSSDDLLSIADGQGKTPIELRAGVMGESPASNHALTRSVLTTDEEKKAAAFKKGTSVYMVLKSEKDDKDAVYTRTIGYMQGISSGDSNAIKFATEYGRFWEDSYSRNSQLSVYAACVPGYYQANSVNETLEGLPNGKIDATTWTIAGSDQYDNEWNDANGVTTLAWPLRGKEIGNQDQDDFVSSQDLCFSNNVAKLSDTDDRRVTFSNEHKKFGKGKLVFYHALTRITFKIKKGEGFTEKDAFAFTNSDENIVLKGFNTSGTFDISEGEFTGAIGTGDINQLAVAEDNRSTNGTYSYVLDGLMLPGSDLSSTSADEIYFTIDYNLYHMSKSMLLEALNGKTLSDGSTPALDGNKMRAGVHYVFTMSVGKKKMDSFTASVVDWETVEADEFKPSNARILISFLKNGDPIADPNNLDLFRSANVDGADSINDDFESFDWATGYTSKAQLIQNTEAPTGVYEAKEANNDAWYWPDNKTFYHFRTVMPKTTDAWKVETKDGSDYITLKAAQSYTDVCWGAPFTTSTMPAYDYKTYGYDGNAAHQISKAIGPLDTDDSKSGPVTIVMFHMMSDVVINLTTTTGDDQVALAGADLELSNIHPSAKVLMGNGLVQPSEEVTTVTDITDGGHYGFVPQSLDTVVLTITTADNNQYIIDMKDVKRGSDKIDRWLPNHKYIYTFKLTKAGIAKMTATLMKWEKVEAGDDNVQIR